MRYEQRQSINNELGRYDPSSGPMPGFETESNFDRMQAEMAWTAEHGQGKQGTATRHITSNYDSTMGEFDENKVVGTLESKAERYKALNELTQEMGGGAPAAQEGRCGGLVLMAGSMLAGGGGGLTTLINAVEAFKKGHNGGPLSKEALEQIATLDKLKEKIADGKKLTMGDLASASSNVFELMLTGENSQGGGLKDKDVEALMKESPELRKLWKKNDLSYDSIDVTGGGSGGHAVLGIGHGSSDDKHDGPHAAIYDPYHRARKDPEVEKEIEELQQKVGDSGGIYKYMYMQKLADAQARSRTELGQLITDPRELKAYQNATTRAFELNGSEKDGGVKHRGFNLPNVYNGMY